MGWWLSWIGLERMSSQVDRKRWSSRIWINSVIPSVQVHNEGRVESVWTKVKLYWPRSKVESSHHVSKVRSSWSKSKVELSRHLPMIEQSRSELKSSQVGSGQSWAKSDRAKVKPSPFGSRSSLVDLSRRSKQVNPVQRSIRVNLDWRLNQVSPDRSWASQSVPKIEPSRSKLNLHELILTKS